MRITRETEPNHYITDASKHFYEAIELSDVIIYLRSCSVMVNQCQY